MIMALLPDQKFSTFASGGTPTTGDIVVGLRGGINTKFNWVLPDNIASLTGTASEVLIDGTSGVPVTGDAIVSLALNPILPGVAGFTLPQGSTAQQAGDAGSMRFNTDTLVFEGTTDGSVWNAFSTSSGTVLSVTGTANQVLVNATTGSPQTGALTLTLPQDIGTTSNVQFNTVRLNNNLIYDSNGNPMLAFNATAGTITNYFRIDNSTTGNVVQLSAIGSDPNVSMQAVLQGAGTFGIVSTSNIPFIIYSGTTNQHQTNFSFANTAASRIVTFQDSSGTLAYLTDIPSVVPAALTRTNDTNVTLTLGGTPATALLQATSLTLGWTGLLGITRGGTGVGSVTIAPTASAFAGWDANSNLSANSFIAGFASTASSGASTTLTVASAEVQQITGTLTHTVVMPVTSTLVQGQAYQIINNSSGAVTVNSSGGNAIQVMAANTTLFLDCILTSGTTAASWNSSYVFDGGAGVLSITGTANQVIASASTGAVILSLPQSIATNSAVQFNTVRLNANLMLDSNGNSILGFTAGAGTIANYFAVGNFSTGNPVQFGGVGTDSNISMQAVPKGTGDFEILATTNTPFVIFSGTTHQHQTNFTFANTANNRTVTFPDADGTVQFTTSSGGLKSFQNFTSGTAATYTRPAGITSILVEVLGGGAGGGGTAATSASGSAAGGGGGGGYARKWIASASSSYTYTVGAAANGGTAGNNAGTAGNNSSFDTITANGGGAGGGDSSHATPSNGGTAGAGGTASGGDINISGGTGAKGGVPTGGAFGGSGGGTVYGSPTATSYSSNATQAGANGITNSGSGGSGAANNGTVAAAAGGNGAAGLIIVWEFA